MARIVNKFQRVVPLIRVLAACPLLLLASSCFLGDELEGHGAPAHATARAQAHLSAAPGAVAVASTAELRPSFRVVIDDAGHPGQGPAGAVTLAGTRLIYLNKNGGVYDGDDNGQSDSRGNITALLPSARSVSIAAWSRGDQGFQQVLDCVRQKFARFDVEITDQDPCAGNDACSVPHLEAVVGGRATDFDDDMVAGGVSPFTSSCGVIENSIVFAFAEHFEDDFEVICDITAQEIAHSYGLDHEYLCEDPMSYLKMHPETGEACVDRSFMSFEAPCGEDSPRPCMSEELGYDCRRERQNSVLLLSSALGFRADPNPPSVSVEFPQDGAQVQPGFSVLAEASDDIAVDRVELYIDGVKAFEDPIPPYELVASQAVTGGQHEIEVRAYDAQGYASQTLQLEVDGEAASANVLGGCAAGSTGAGLWWLPLLMGWYWRRR